MKPNYCLFLFLLCITIIGHTQSYQISYHEYFSRVDGELNNIKESLKKSKTDHKRPVFTLLYKDGTSYYSAQETEHITDDEKKSTESRIVSSQILIPAYYKNQKENLLLQSYPNYSPNLYGEDILIKEKLPNHEWEITDTKANISGYSCTLAKMTRDDGTQILAWFTDKVGLNEGPREYWGLPGLIIQLQINDKNSRSCNCYKKS